MEKFNIKSLFTLVLCAVLILSACVFSTAEQTSADITFGLTVMEKTDEYKNVAQNGSLKLYLNTKTTNFYVEDTTTGKKTFAFPESFAEDDTTVLAQQVEMQSALVFTFWDPVKKSETRKNSNGLSVKQGNYTVYAIENGFLIRYVLKQQQTSICLSVSLKDGKLYCTIPADSIVEESPETSMLIKVAVLPFMISGEANTEGKIILPDGCGEILDFGTTRRTAAPYTKPIYGRDLSTTLSLESKNGYDINCPYLAVIKDDIGILAVPEKGAAVGYVNANPAGLANNYANAYFSYDYRSSDIAIIGDKQTMSSQSTRVFSEDVYDEDFTVSFGFVFNNPSLPAIAQMYGDYILPDSKKATVSHSAVMDIYGFVNEQKSFFGFPYTAVSVLSEGEDIIALANNEKLLGLTINLKNITKDQQKGRLDSNLKPLSKILNSSELDKLNESNAYIYVDADPLTFTKGTLKINSFFAAAKTIYGSPIGLREYRESTHMQNKNAPRKLLLTFSKIGSAIEKLVSSANKLSLDGISSETIASMSYHDYSKKGTLEDTRSSVEAALADASQKTNFILSAPHDYAIKYCSAITDIPTESSGNDLCSGSYPFLQLALSDRISYTTESVNLYRSPETMFLKALATGSALHYSYILSDTEPIIGTELNFLYSADFTAFKEMTERQYAAWKEINSATNSSALVDYTESEGKIISKFENGITVKVDLNSKTYTVD